MTFKSRISSGIIGRDAPIFENLPRVTTTREIFVVPREKSETPVPDADDENDHESYMFMGKGHPHTGTKLQNMSPAILNLITWCKSKTSQIDRNFLVSLSFLKVEETLFEFLYPSVYPL